MTSGRQGLDGELVLRAMTAFGRLPWVHSVGLGGRERAGQATGELVLKVFVSRKRPRSALRSDEMVPPLFEGVPTDIVEAPSPANAAAAPGAPINAHYDEDDGRYRPLRGGVQLTSENCHGHGTLGFLVRADEPSPMRVFAITTHHALFSGPEAEVPDIRVGQPSHRDSVTKCCRAIFGSFTKGYRDDTMDAALIRLEAKAEYYAEIEDIGVVDDEHDVTPQEAATLTYNVRKRGRTTRVTGGTIQALNAVHKSGSPRNYMVIKPNAPTGGGQATFAAFGDSGAAIVNDDKRIVGMLFALGTNESDPNNVDQTGWGFAWAIKDIKDRFAHDGIDLIIETETAPERKKIVEVRPDDIIASEPADSSEAAAIARKVEEDLSKSELGRLLTTVWMRHSLELNRLVNHNRRVAVGWHRAGGAALFQSAIRLASEPERLVPEMIRGRPSDECLREVLDLFQAHGSPQLREDLRACRARLPPVAGRSYTQIVADLRPDALGENRWPG
jgi:hypothetical protein